MFAQFVFLMALIAPALSEFTIQQEHYGHDCIEVSCPKGSFKQISHSLMNDELKEVQCTTCQQCTDNGFSVCAQSRLPSLRAKREDKNASTCTCANSVPAGCRIHDKLIGGKKDPNSEIIHVCYLSALRTPPRPLALNYEEEVVVTLQQFWLESYWKEFELSNLTFFFEFEVKSPKDCDDVGNITTFEGSENPHVCTSSLKIDLNSDDTSYEEDYEDDASKHVAPEIEFAHNVFAGAETVKLWYIVVVKRPRQLNLLKGEPKIQNITTLLNSKTLKFDLQPEIYGMTDEEEKDRGMTRGHANNHLDEEEDEKHGMTDLETEDEDYGMIDLETDDEKMCDCANNQRWWIILVICFVIIAAVITIVGTKLLNCWPRNSPNWMSKCFPKWLQKIVKTDASEMQADRLRKGANNIPADKLELEGNKEDSVFLPNAEPTGAKTALFDEQCKGKIYIQFVLKD